MAEENTDDLESLNEEGEQGTNPDGEETEKDTGQEEGQGEEDVEELKKKAQLAENYRIRAEKAEAKLKKQPKEKAGEETPQNEAKSELSQSDLIYLAKSDIHEDDIEELMNISKVQKKSLKDIHQLSWVKTWLDERQEERNTAEATATTAKRSGTKAPSSNELLQRARTKGELPESDDEMKKLIEAQMQAKARK